MFSSWFPDPHRPSRIMDEERAKQVIDTFLSYRRKEVILTLLMSWFLFLGLLFSLVTTLRFAYIVF